MTISNEDILKYFMTDEYPHDAGTLAAKEKIEQLQHQLNESDARACRLENGLIGCAKTLREYNEADSHVYLSLTKETKSQSLQHIQAEAVEKELLLLSKQYLNEGLSNKFTGFDVSQNIEARVNQLRQQPIG